MSSPMQAILAPELRPYFLDNLRAFAPLHVLWGKRVYMKGVDERSDYPELTFQQVSPVKSFIDGWKLRTPRLVVPEPFWYRQYPTSFPFLLGFRLGCLVRRSSAKVGTYCIDNSFPEKLLKLPARIPAPIRARLAKWVAAPYLAMIDDIVFGTDGSRETYSRTFGKSFDQFPTVIPRPVRYGKRIQPIDRKRFAFVGSLRREKGISLMLAAWDEVSKRRDDLSLEVAGIGELAPQVREWAKLHPSVTFTEGATRSEVFELLNRTGCHIQLSMPGVRFREQVGSSNLEALSCEHRLIVTEETGIANWLKDLGHGVLPISASPSEVADLIEKFADDNDWEAPEATFGEVDGYVEAHDLLLERAGK